MERRELLKALSALPLVKVMAGQEEVSAVELTLKSHYIVFVSADQRFDDILVPKDHPLAYAPIVPIYLNHGQKIEDVIAIYKIDEEKNSEP